MKHTLSVPSPIGKLWLQEEDGALVRVSFQPDAASQTEEETPLLGQAKQQLAEYFAGQRQAFDLPLRMQGNPLRGDQKLRPDCGAGGQSKSQPRGGDGQQPQPHRHHRALPPGHRRKRLADRICRGT